LCGIAQQIAVEIVEHITYVEYMRHLLAGSVALAVHLTVMLFLVGFGHRPRWRSRLPCSSALLNSGRALMWQNALDKPLSIERLSDKMRINRNHNR
jgi:hypothetical protein